MGPVRSDRCLRRVLTGVAQPPGEAGAWAGGWPLASPRPVRRGAARPAGGACGERLRVGPGGGAAAATAAAGGGLTGTVQASVHRPATGARRRLRGEVACGPGRRGRCGHGCGRGRSDGARSRRPCTVRPPVRPSRNRSSPAGPGRSWPLPGTLVTRPRRGDAHGQLGRPLRPRRGGPARPGQVSAVPCSPPPVSRPLPTGAAAAGGCRPCPVCVRAPCHRVQSSGVGKGGRRAGCRPLCRCRGGCVSARARIPG
ncbi:hypothetical protein SUDANB19_06634 (plasmid) [Streptomyces sp. enrichment culture]